ncbi:MAG: hypothetical protein HY053_00570, partial [Proteobacteria bacterium]|nr:hypothetical protein [Pseudomonadota bacterium]
MADPHFLELAQATGAPAAARRRAVLPPVVNPPTNLIPHPKLKGSYLLVPVDGKGPAYGNEVNVPRWLGSNTKVLTMLAHVMVRRANVLDPNHVKTPDGIALREFISRSFPNEGMRLAVDDLAWFGKLAKDDPKKLEEVAARFGMRGEELAALAMTPEQAKKVHRLASQHRSPTDHLGGVPNPKPGTEYDRDLGREEDLKYSVLLRRVAELCGINMDKTKIVTLQGAHWSSRTPPTNEMSVWSAFLFTKKLHETGGPELMRRYGDPNGGWPHIGRGH